MITRIVIGIMSAKQWRFCGHRVAPTWHGMEALKRFPGLGWRCWRYQAGSRCSTEKIFHPWFAESMGNLILFEKKYLLGSSSKSKMGMDVGDVGDVGWKLDNPLRRPRSDFFRWPSSRHPGTSQLECFTIRNPDYLRLFCFNQVSQTNNGDDIDRTGRM